MPKLLIIFIYCFLNFSKSKKVVWLSISSFPTLYVNNEDTPTLVELIEKGVSSLKLSPLFPTVSLPNQQTLITGLNVETHGIVNEKIRIPKGSMKNYTENFDKDSLELAWWDVTGNLRPIFTANELANPNHKSSSIFWPGAAVRYSNHLISKFDQHSDPSVNFSERINRAIRDLSDHNLVVLYVEDLKSAGVNYGPNSIEVRKLVKEMDKSIKHLVEAVQKETDTDLIITSDHGISSIKGDAKKEFFEWQYAAANFDYENFGAIVTLFPVFQGGRFVVTPEEIVTQLNKLKDRHFTAYLKKDIPSFLNYSKSERIAPVVIIFDTGYICSLPSQSKPVKGNFGWPAENSLDMNGIFVAIGPSFQNHKNITEIKTVDIYGIVCKILDIEKACHPHNGNIELIASILSKEQVSSNHALEIALPIVFILIIIAVVVGIIIIKTGINKKILLLIKKNNKLNR